MDHIDDDLLELYALGQIASERLLVAVEEHILVYSLCQDRLRWNDEYIQYVRAALELLSATLELRAADHRRRGND